MANPQPGIIEVTFDAGGVGSSVNANPQAFGKVSKNTFYAEWKLTSTLNTGDGFVPQFGNVVPCHQDQLPRGYTFTSEPVYDPVSNLKNGWRWKFVRSGGVKPSKLIGQIEYEIFFSYGPFRDPEAPWIAKLHERTVAFGQAFQVDPSLILPPRSPGGGGRSD